MLRTNISMQTSACIHICHISSQTPYFTVWMLHYIRLFGHICIPARCKPLIPHVNICKPYIHKGPWQAKFDLQSVLLLHIANLKTLHSTKLCAIMISYIVPGFFAISINLGSEREVKTERGSNTSGPQATNHWRQARSTSNNRQPRQQQQQQ